MTGANQPAGISVYSVAVSPRDKERWLRPDYLSSVIACARLAEDFGYTGMLMHYNLKTIEPWLLLGKIFEHTKSLTPLIAAQPLALPPHTLARLVMGAREIFGRTIDLNLITGAAQEELVALGDTIDHDERYKRLHEYVSVLEDLLSGETCNFAGHYYQYNALSIADSNQRWTGQYWVAGSSPAAIALAANYADVYVSHPAYVSPEELISPFSGPRFPSIAIRIGIVARPTQLEARSVADALFPQSRMGQVRTVMQQQSESHWIRGLAKAALDDEGQSLVWYGSILGGRASCAYLVGDYRQIGACLGQLRQAGVQRLLLDGPFTETEATHIAAAFREVG